jgi:hypothetical protein
MFQVVYAQSSFEVNYDEGDHESLYYTFETNDGDYITVGSLKAVTSPYLISILILKINSLGEITNEVSYTKSDTNFILQYGYEKANGNYFLMGTLTDLEMYNDFNVTYVCERTPDLELVWEKFFHLPEPYNHHRLTNFLLDADSNLIISGSADSSNAGYDKLLLTMVYDKYGNRQNINFYQGWTNYGITNEMIFNSDSTSIQFFGVYCKSTIFLNEYIEMDLDLNITDYISIIDEEHFISSPVTVKRLPNTNFIQANKTFGEPNTFQDLYVKVFNEDFDVLRDTILYFPEKVNIPYYNGLDFIDTNLIWIPTHEMEFNWIPGTEIFTVHIFDSQLNLIGLKEYGGDKRYWLYHMFVTSDGGCLITGDVPEYNGSENYNGYIIKIMPEDIITNAEETSFENDRDVMVYPNPFVNEIKQQTVRKGLTFELYDINGKKLITNNIIDNQISKVYTYKIIPGVYFYLIRENSKIVQSGRLLK